MKNINSNRFITSTRKLIENNPITKAALTLIISSGATAVLGFVFWIVIARSFTVSTVGVATTMITVSGVLALLSLCGLDVVFVRFLPRSKNRNDLVNSGLIISALFSIALAIIFCLFASKFSPQLAILSQNILYSISFILFTVLTTWGVLIGSAFIAYRKTIFTLLISISVSAAKIILPFVIRSNEPITIFIIVSLAQLVSVVISFILLIKYCEYIPSIKIRPKIILERLRFTIAMYVSNVINIMPDLVLPLIVINQLGSISSAYFYIAFTIANLLYTIAFSTSQVLLAESAHDEEHYLNHARNGLKIVTLLMLPAVVIVVALSPYILSIFGDGYKNGALAIMQILAISGLAVMLYSFLGFIFKQTQNLKSLLAMMITNGVAIIGLALIWTKPYGLPGIGFSWLVGTIIAVIVGAVSLLITQQSKSTEAVSRP